MAARKVFALALALVFSLWGVFPALALESSAALGASASLGESADVVTNMDELRDWLVAHRATGGEVFFGNSITLNGNVAVYGVAAPITVNTGAFGLVYDGGQLAVDNCEIIGDGVETPVLTVINAYPLPRFAASWVHAVQALFVTATGRGGEGGTAVLVARDDGKAPNPSLFLQEGRIRSYGDGAVGIELAAATEAHCLRVEVAGAGSTAVLAPEGAALSYCKLSATGEGAAAVRGSGIRLNTCAASPEPEENHVVVREQRFVDTAGKALYLPVRQGEDADLFPYGTMSFVLADGSGEEEIGSFVVVWDQSAASGIDSAALGKTVVHGALLPPFQGLGLEDDFPLALTVDIRDPAIPCICAARVSSSAEDGDFIQMFLWKSGAWSMGDVLLWRSDDGGESWRDVTASGALRMTEQSDQYSLQYSFDNIDGQVQLQAAVPGVGESNVAAFHQKDGRVTGDLGGDRTGTDRDGASKPGPLPEEEVETPPEGEEKPGDKDADEDDAPPSVDGGDDGGTGPGGTDGPGSPGTPAPPDTDAGNRDSHTGGTANTRNVDARNQDRDRDTGAHSPAAFAAPTPVAAPSPVSPIAPPPETASTAIEPPATAPPREYQTATDTAISGERLAGLIASNPAGVTFIKGDMRIVVDTAALAALALADQQLFVVVFDPDSGTVRFLVDGEVVGLPYTQLREKPQADDDALPLAYPGTARSRTAPSAPVPQSQPAGTNSGVAALSVGISSVAVTGGGLLFRRHRVRR